MDVVDAFCDQHQEPYRWMSGTPLWCPQCYDEHHPQVNRQGTELPAQQLSLTEETNEYPLQFFAES